MSQPLSRPPACIIIAGPNGAGKTTFAREFLPKDAGVIHFVYADLIAGGLSPLQPDLAALTAGRPFLAELDRLARARADFALETTLSGLGYRARLRRWKRPVTASKSSISALPLHDSHSDALPHGSNREATTSHEPMYCDGGSPAAGRISKPPIAHSPTRGQSMTIPGRFPDSWRPDHETNQWKENQEDLRRGGRQRPPARRAGRPQGRPRPRHTHLRLAGWQDRGAETLMSSVAVWSCNSSRNPEKRLS